jgi:hypothetical protein
VITQHASLADWVRSIRRDAVLRDDVLVFKPLPLFVAIAFFIEEQQMFDCYSEAIDDGHGDPVDLDVGDQRQTSRLEDAILRRSDGLVAFRELLSIDWFDLDSGPRSINICVVSTPEDGLIVLQDDHGPPSFQVVAPGPERRLQQVLADAPCLALPRLASRGADLRRVVLRAMVTMAWKDLVGIVDAVVGVEVRGAHVLRGELLTLPDDEAVAAE